MRHLIDAVIQQESRGDPRAVNRRTGAAGLMQIMPATARDPGFGVRPMDWRRRFDADENRRFGSEYLMAMVDRYGGDTRRALVAYNWGPGNADRWDGDFSSLPAETREYVQNIESDLAQAESFGEEVTDPAVIRRLEAEFAAPRPEFGEPVTDPEMIKRLEGEFAEQAQGAPPPAPQSTDDILGGLIDSVTQGASFGFGDELTGIEAGLLGRTPEGGWFDYLGTFGERRRAATDAERAQQEQFAEENPVLATAGEVGGALATGVGAGRAGLTLLGRGGTAGRNVAAGAAEGSVYGSTYAAGTADAGRGEAALYGAMGGAVAGGALSAGGALIQKWLAARAASRAAPTNEALKRAADQAYARARDANPVFNGVAFKAFTTRLFDEMADEGIDRTLHPRATRALKRLAKTAGAPDFKRVETLRRVVAAAARSLDPSERRLAQIMLTRLDEFIGASGSGAADDVVRGRARYATLKRSELIDDATLRSQRAAASAGSGGNRDNAIRQNIKAILNNPKKRRGFNAEEIAAMERVVRGGKVQNMFRLVGKLSPAGNGLMLGLGLGATAYNPAMIAFPIAGLTSKKVAELLTARNVKRLSELVRSRGLPPATTGLVVKRLQAMARPQGLSGFAGQEVSQEALLAR